MTNPPDAGRAASATDTHRLILRTDAAWNSVKVFTGALLDGEHPIGEQVTQWLAAHSVQLVEVVIAQSADEGGCISIGLFYRPTPQ
jgi:hypothetical protein